MAAYVIQYNEREDNYSVFDDNEKWVGVFRSHEHAAKFIRLVLEGELQW